MPRQISQRSISGKPDPPIVSKLASYSLYKEQDSNNEKDKQQKTAI